MSIKFFGETRVKDWFFRPSVFHTHFFLFLYLSTPKKAGVEYRRSFFPILEKRSKFSESYKSHILHSVHTKISWCAKISPSFSFASFSFVHSFPILWISLFSRIFLEQYRRRRIWCAYISRNVRIVGRDRKENEKLRYKEQRILLLSWLNLWIPISGKNGFG